VFSAVLQQATGMLQRRFILNAFFPSLVFWGAIVIVYLNGRGDFGAAVQSLDARDATFKITVTIAFVAWVWFFAGIIASQWRNLTRLYEGYWRRPPLSWLRNKGRAWHRSQLEDLNNRGQNEVIYYNYPRPDDMRRVMPTQLGNILRNSELYARNRFGIRSALIWSRLYHLLPERFIGVSADARASLEFLLVISFLGGVFGVATGIYLLIVGADWRLFLVCFWGGCLVALAAYRGSISNAIVYAQTVKAAFDLYRNELLKQMRIELPCSPAEERRIWQDLQDFLYRNEPPESLRYVKEAMDEENISRA
jgi:hypothetical protein